MEPKKELDEQTYQSNKKKLNMIALGILITAVVIGLGLIIVPRVTTNTSAPAVISDSELDAQIAVIQSEYTKKMGDPGWFEEQGIKDDKISAARKAKSNADSAAFKAEGENSFTTFRSVAIIIIGAGVAGNLFYFANFRKIAGYTAQGVMPVAKESITGVAPNIGDVAREIKKGMNQADKSDKK